MEDGGVNIHPDPRPGPDTAALCDIAFPRFLLPISLRPPHRLTQYHGCVITKGCGGGSAAGRAKPWNGAVLRSGCSAASETCSPTVEGIHLIILRRTVCNTAVHRSRQTHHTHCWQHAKRMSVSHHHSGLTPYTRPSGPYRRRLSCYCAEYRPAPDLGCLHNTGSISNDTLPHIKRRRRRRPAAAASQETNQPIQPAPSRPEVVVRDSSTLPVRPSAPAVGVPSGTPLYMPDRCAN